MKPVPGPSEHGFVASLRRALDSINAGVKNPGILAVLARGFPEAFVRCASELLDSGEESEGHRCLALVLSRQEAALEFVSTPENCALPAAVRLFRRMWSADPTLDFRLARLLPRGQAPTHDKVLTGAQAVRAIDILDEISTGQRLMSVMGRLPYSGDPRIASRAALFIGRRVRNHAWVRNQLNQDNARLRANVVESTWGSTSEESVRILHECSEDDDNRVAGNALLGLHVAGHPDVAERVHRLAASEQSERRSTAAWVMGKTGSTVFRARLAELLRDENSVVRRAALRALVEIRRARQESTGVVDVVSAGDAEAPVAGSVVTEPMGPEIPAVSIVPSFDGTSFKVRSAK